jgi:hypothetical protein
MLRVAAAGDGGDNTPISGRPDEDCAPTASGQPPAAPPSSEMNERRLMEALSPQA